MESNTLARWAASNPPKIQGGFVISKRYHWPRDMNWIAEQSKEAKSKHLGWSWQAMAWWCSYQYICGYILIYQYIYHIYEQNLWTLDVHSDAECIGAKLYIGGGTSKSTDFRRTQFAWGTYLTQQRKSTFWYCFPFLWFTFEPSDKMHIRQRCIFVH